MTIVGIIANLTIPAFITTIQNQSTVTTLLKFQSTMSQALIALNANDVDIAGMTGSSTDSTTLLNMFVSKLNVVKNCGLASGCFPLGVKYKYLNGLSGGAAQIVDTSPWLAKAILSDSSMIYVYNAADNCSYVYGTGPLSTACGAVGIDVNGTKGPNVAGRDLFEFVVTKNAIIPRGVVYDNSQCDTNGSTWNTSLACTAKVLLERTITY